MIVSNGICPIALVRRDMNDNCFLDDDVRAKALEGRHVFDDVSSITCVELLTSDGVRLMTSVH